MGALGTRLAERRLRVGPDHPDLRHPCRAHPPLGRRRGGLGLRPVQRSGGIMDQGRPVAGGHPDGTAGSTGQLNQPARPLAVAVLGRGVVDPDTPVIHADDRGLLRGLAAFETLRVYAGRPFAMSEHLARLAASAERMHLRGPRPRCPGAAGQRGRRRRWGGRLHAATDAHGWSRRRTARGPGHRGRPAGRPRRAARRRHRRRLAAAGHRPSRAPGCPVAAHGCEVDLVCGQHGRARGGRAPRRRGRHLRGGRWLGAGGAHDQRLVAAWRHPLHAGPGPRHPRRRDESLRAAPGLGLRVTRPQRAGIPLADLAAAEEAFTSSSIRELMPIVRLDGQAVGAGRPGEAVRTLHAALRRAALA